jgi:DNA invertase Pin-like site-specific DNA recombinase
MRRPKKQFSEQELTEVIELYQDGRSLREISAKYNCNHMTVYKALKDNNIALRKKGRQKGKPTDFSHHFHLTDKSETLSNSNIVENT